MKKEKWWKTHAAETAENTPAPEAPAAAEGKGRAPAATKPVASMKPGVQAKIAREKELSASESAS